jgi:NlpC/P60 family
VGRRTTPAVLLILALAGQAGGCAGDTRSLREVLDETALQARIGARAATLVGHGPGPFTVGPETFGADCSGLVEAVYAAEGIPLRRLLQADAPRASSAVEAAWITAGTRGRRWRSGDWPAPGDLVFFDDTWDRNGNGRRDDPLTHVGVVEWVEPDGTVHFVHRISRGVVRGRLSLAHQGVASEPGGRVLNSWLRVKGGPDDAWPTLAGELFAGFGRVLGAR